jgi:outer membrane protein OmpA-like peptidoglycan-associated protein
MKQIITTVFFSACLFASAQDSLSIYFGFDSYKVLNQSKAELKVLSDKTITSIYGYTDSRGNNDYNIQLAQKRINATLNYLGINASSIPQIFALGEEKLTSSIHSENRKVVIYFSTNQSQVNNSKKTTEPKSEKGIGDQIVQAKIGDKVKLKALNFQPGLDILLPEAVPTLEELLKVMKSNQKLVIQVQGHICCASADFADLSTARAYRVYEYLLNNGIQAERISYIGFGVSQPLYTIPEKSSSEEIANRRVEVKIISN